MKVLVPEERIEQRIFLIRGHKVMLDSDLAELFGVETKQLNRQVKRNKERFPKEFMFQLTREERIQLVPIWHQFRKMKHSYVLPYAFTEHGVAMVASVLNSERAIRMSIIIIKSFIKLRQILATHKELSHRLNELEDRIDKHDYDIQEILQAIRQLLEPPVKKIRVITGFKVVK